MSCRASIILMSLLAAWAAHGSGCTRHSVEVQPIRVEPIHLTIDVNVRVDRELDEFFDYERRLPPEVPANGEATEPGVDAPAVPEAAPSPEPVVPPSTAPEEPGAANSQSGGVL